MKIQEEERPNCPVCNSSKTRKDSVRKTLLCDKQRWFCKACGKRWVNSPIRNIKGDPKTVVTVMDLYMKGVSYRSIADHLKQIYGLEVSHITVMNWVNTYLSRITQFVKSMARPEAMMMQGELSRKQRKQLERKPRQWSLARLIG
ncbi:MAG: hypothetical protein QS99_C0012G0013 [archaeon GW2011_AR4]|nr:MAG: hypothetical protein QS99_C0012G0013 [archaeon GW2011_AR4]